jgi:hypothetical protein
MALDRALAELQQASRLMGRRVTVLVGPMSDKPRSRSTS